MGILGSRQRTLYGAPMPFNNKLAILLLGVLVGAAINIAYIGSQAFLLSVTQPIYALYVAVASGVLLSALLIKFRLDKFKFATFSVWATVAYLLLFLTLLLNFYSDFTKALVWFFLATFGMGFFRWMTSEMAIKHLDPARAQTYFSYLATSFEVGTIVVLLSLKIYGISLSPNQMIYLGATIFGLLILFFLIQFCPKKNFEVKFSKKSMAAPAIKKSLFKSLLISFIILSALMGACEVSEKYLIKVVLKENLGSFDAIRNLMTTYILIASGLVMLMSLAVGRLIQNKRVSPILLLGFQVGILSMFGISCLATGSFYFFVAFEVARRVSGNVLFSPAYQMIMASFIGKFRNKMRSVYNFYYYTIIGIPLVILFSYIHKSIPHMQEELILGLILILSAGSFFLLFRFRKQLIAIMYEFIRSSHKAASIIGIQTLSYLRPRDYEPRMTALLSEDPKKLLRKTIILGLGYLGSDSSVDAIIKEFSTEKEEIQFAILDALQTSQHYRATQFMTNIVLAQEKSQSFRLRMNATSIIAAMYGKKAIPFLLNGLNDPDPRVVANTLETLRVFKDKALIPYFQQFSESSNPRIRANTLMGLAQFRKTRKASRQSIRDVLEGNDESMLASFLYAIGKLKERSFYRELEKIYESESRKKEKVKYTLAWALTRLKNKHGFDLFGVILGTPYQEKVKDPVMHFLSQLSQEARFDLIEYLAVHQYEDTNFIKNIGDKLKYSPFDFHQELDYFNMIVRELRRKAQK